jgi:hypothetical protein
VYGYVLGLIFFGMFFLILLINTSAVRKNYRKSDSRLYELGKLDEAEAEYSAPESFRYPKSKLILSKQFVFCGVSGWIVPYEDIAGLPSDAAQLRNPDLQTDRCGLNNGKTVVLVGKRA